MILNKEITQAVEQAKQARLNTTKPSGDIVTKK